MLYKKTKNRKNRHLKSSLAFLWYNKKDLNNLNHE